MISCTGRLNHSLVPWENHVTSLLSHQPLSAFKDGEYRQWGLVAITTLRRTFSQSSYLQNSPNSHNLYRPCAAFKWPIQGSNLWIVINVLKNFLRCDLLQSTYDYGRQFLQASLVLRRTCRYELSPNYEMEEKLNNAWSDFSSVMAERGARLSVALMFHRSAEKVRTIIIQLLLVIVLSFRLVVRNLKSLGRLPVYTLTGPNHTNETLFHKPNET